MTQREKLIAKIRARPVEADASDVIAILEEFGWVLRNQRGSHLVFKKPGERSLTVPLIHGRRVRRVYLDEIIERLALEE